MNTITNVKTSNAGGRNLPPLTKAPFIIKTRSGPREPAERTGWPRIGRLSDADLEPNSEFGTDDFLGRYDPGDDVFAYMCGSPGTMALGRQLRLPLYKVGLSQVSDLLVRQRQISADAYGGYRRERENWIRDSGFDLYEMQTAELRFEPHPKSPVSLVSRGLRVRLPTTMSFPTFHAALHRVLAPTTLNGFLTSASGRRHLALLGADPQSQLRYTRYQWGTGAGSGVEYRLANELTICRPRRDFSALAVAIEEAITAHVLSLPKH